MGKTEKQPETIEVTIVELEKIKSDSKDLKDLYNNEVIKTQELTKEVNEVKADLIIKQEIIIDNLQEDNETIDDLKEDIIKYENDMTKNEAIIGCLEDQIEMLQEIVNNLIKA